MRIAIVGTGISGMVAAHLLYRTHDLTVFEQADYIGGHTATIDVPAGDRTLAIDTGFIVYNDWTYPNFCRLLRELGVATQPSNMSFSVQCERTALEYCGNNIRSLFAQRRNLVRPSFYRMLSDIFRFYRQSRELLNGRGDDETTLGQYLDENRYSRIFIDQHIVPMGAAIWSADPVEFLRFPARNFVRFFANHGMLNVLRRPIWRVIQGGSREYARKLTAPWRERVRLRTGVTSIRRGQDAVEITTTSGETQVFDEVILAVHSDQALKMLADPTPVEREVLSAIPYQPNETVLHTDTRLLPRRRRAWAAWNYHVPREENAAATVTYNMNILQGLDAERTYCVSLNRTAEIDPDRIIRRFVYDHPVFTPACNRAQGRHAEISGVNRTHYCGAYWGYGFHEDGVRSALLACQGIAGVVVPPVLSADTSAARAQAG